jgi:hypothetical protein
MRDCTLCSHRGGQGFESPQLHREIAGQASTLEFLSLDVGAKSFTSGMAGASRRGYGEAGIYFDHRADCRDSAHHKTCSGRWRGVVSLGFDAGGAEADVAHTCDADAAEGAQLPYEGSSAR